MSSPHQGKNQPGQDDSQSFRDFSYSSSTPRRPGRYTAASVSAQLPQWRRRDFFACLLVY